ncbi:MAG: TonB-dependent receptor [Bacteroidales bacterium]|nr:TonB-dependent receptor [Bacteroidales bacterium]
MSKGVKLMAAACCLATGALAQAPSDTLRVFDDNSDFTFTETQLDEDNDASQAISSITSTRSDYFLSEVGYRFSAMRFRVRAYDNMYSKTAMNGILLNDLEGGRFSYGLIGGMNDAVRNQEGVPGFGYNTFALPGLGGATSINTRASQFATGSKLAVSGCNRNYVARGMFTHATGLMDNGWALAGSVGYRWANEGVIEGTFYNSFSYFLSAEKVFNDQHSLSLVTFGSPTERGQQAASTEEAYWLANSHYYNPNWGYQNGEKRNARVVKSFEPTAILTWDWKKDDRWKLVTAAAFKYSKYGTTALGWNGDAYDPRPDYYKNLPSSIFNVYDPEKNNPDYLAQNPFLLEQYNNLVDYWTACEANQQINWDRMYYVNRQQNQAGGEALYYQERRNNDQMVMALNSTFNHLLDRYNKYTVGFRFNATKGMHYKTMEDLLGGNRYIDIDKFAINDYGPNSDEAQNDLRNPNRSISEGDKFGYNYNIFVNKANLWAQYQYSRGIFGLNLGGNVEGTTIEREGLMQNGRAPENSYGKSGKARFLSGGGRAQITLRPAAGHLLSFSGVATTNAPLARNSFVAPRIQNNFVDNLKVEKVYGGEASYSINWGGLTGKITGYYTRFSDGVEQTAYYNDQQSTFTYLTMTGVEKVHYGLEAALNYKIFGNLSANFMLSMGNAKYTDNPYAQVNYEGMNYAETQKLNQCTNPVTGQAQDLRVVAKDMHVGSTPLTAVSIGLEYNVKGWFFEANLNYYDRVYVAFSPYRRLNSTYQTAGRFYLPSSVDAAGNLAYDVTAKELHTNGGVLFDGEGNVVHAYAAEQEKFDGGFMLDASIGKFIRLKKGRTLSINLSLQNITNNRNLRTGGYEQNRDDNYYNESGGQYTKGESKAYQFSKNSKYYYANAINAFLNIGFRF